MDRMTVEKINMSLNELKKTAEDFTAQYEIDMFNAVFKNFKDTVLHDSKSMTDLEMFTLFNTYDSLFRYCLSELMNMINMRQQVVSVNNLKDRINEKSETKSAYIG